jgi:hypothetical protein
VKEELVGFSLDQNGFKTVWDRVTRGTTEEKFPPPFSGGVSCATSVYRLMVVISRKN